MKRIGALSSGVLMGNYMDKQAEEISRDIKNARVERIGIGIKITFDSCLLFETNSARLSSHAEVSIRDLAGILKRYEDTDILVRGHTDLEGTVDYNKKLSQRWAEAVADLAKGFGVKGSRFTTIGYGNIQPIVPDATPEGRQRNHRIEIAVIVKDDFKSAAEKNKQTIPSS